MDVREFQEKLKEYRKLPAVRAETLRRNRSVRLSGTRDWTAASRRVFSVISHRREFP